MSRKSSAERRELDIPTPLAIGLGALIAIAIYALLYPIQNSYLGVLLYKRGITQPIAIFFAGIVTAIVVLKFIKIQTENQALGQLWIPNNIPLNDPSSRQLAALENHLAHSGYLLTSRCSRIVRAYLESGSRKTASEFALDDSSFYLTASEAFYSVPKILVWAIPLLGFIGTVVGISQAVNGFSGFLDKAAEVEQIKEGIGTVTSGLAVAFDTTLLALFLSVLVMIPLVLVERAESRFLLAIDVYINERVLPRFVDAGEGMNDSSMIASAIARSVRESLPQPEDLIAPAREYAREAASELAKTFASEFEGFRELNERLTQNLERVGKLIIKDRKEFITYLETQKQSDLELVEKIQAAIIGINTTNSAAAEQLAEQTQQISEQLQQVTKALSNRLDSLEKCTEQVLEVARLQQNLDRSLRHLQETGQFGQTLTQIQDNLGQLKPLLKQLGKPRRITLVENDEADEEN
ncbi:MotA/TolQ/ExbB proton channel family protein [Oscillatoria sp. FACHB-1406]|uniref:MotA/TolQ/ExbB proton channel family protein n=1 Tax=Oscillatoria sp. FACHB-1406 TaxID=2692846 RepID=UPI0016882C91|nr:MotA/TolQ/ExbB proton channel family protein [Oscillatoria sp. FACHB-1406]MBD2576885.1 MotA/TolQ/ExbB proton channel family protein [Oscillatoria sp. FACHB-1406]